jgi:hypothetical protein
MLKCTLLPYGYGTQEGLSKSAVFFSDMAPLPDAALSSTPPGTHMLVAFVSNFFVLVRWRGLFTWRIC